ncbi:MAG TPA: hypothetical protein VLG09_03275 [Candidatus Saccharimonadales bacterium]|nr:hypothetical protein [Candidatus Saccharimonadales bacterium]
MQQPTLYQDNRQQLFMIAITVFGSIVTAVIVSTIIVMSLMKGEVANALSVNNAQQQAKVASVDTTPTVAGCTSPVDTEASSGSTTPAETPAEDMPLTTMYAAPTPPPAPESKVINSFNTTNVNNTASTEVHNKTTVIKDSFNDNSVDSHDKLVNSNNSVVVKDNNTIVASGDAHAAIVDIDKTVTVNSNNTIASNNTVADNSVNVPTPIIAPAVVVPSV